MTSFEAITLIEDTPEVTEAQYLDAFQCLIDSGVVWQLQGWYGRTARQLIDSGYCTTRNLRTHTHNKQ